LLVAAAVTLFLNPNVGALNYANVPGLQKLNIFNFEFFAVTAYLSLILLVLGVAWGLLRSLKSVQNTCEVPSNPTRFIGWTVLLVIFSPFANCSHSYWHRCSAPRRRAFSEPRSN
jgi:hypothetical protein